MVRSVAAASVLVLLLTGPRSASAAATPNKAKVHGIALSGTISRIDSARMTFAVRNAAGREVALSWTRATKIIGGNLKLGELVTLRYFERDSRHIAATIRLGSPQPSASPTRSAANRAPSREP